MFGILTAVDVHSLNIRGIALDSRETQADPAILFTAAESAAISPCGIKVTVRSPRNRPEVAAARILAKS